MYKVTLKSDFEQPYDKYFTQDGVEFQRISSGGPNKIQQFEKLRSLGYFVPQHGIVKELSSQFPTLVVYTDINQHEGKGKLLLPSTVATDLYPDNFCCEFIECSQQITTSYKLLQIGKRQFIIRYSSDHEWMANQGRYAVDILAESPLKQYIDAVPQPIWSIDYICDINKKDIPVAVDFNVSPKFNDLDLHFFISNQDIAHEVSDAINYYSTLS